MDSESNAIENGSTEGCVAELRDLDTKTVIAGKKLFWGAVSHARLTWDSVCSLKLVEMIVVCYCIDLKKFDAKLSLHLKYQNKAVYFMEHATLVR